MTKRKASVALDSVNESNTNGLKAIANNSNGNNGTGALDTCNNNKGDNSVIPGGANHQAGRAIHPSSMSNTGDCQQHQDTSNNQNDNSVDSDGNNGAASNRHRSKKERADNWSSAEIQILHKGIESRRDVFYGPPSQATKKNRESAWEAITREVNAVSTTPRSLGQVMKKFKNEKCRAKSKFANPDKEGHSSNDNSVSNNNNLMCNNNSNTNNNNVSNSDQTNSTSNRTATNDATATINLSAQNQPTSNQQLTQSQHHMTNPESMSAPQSSINVVKLAPQNVAKTMIDLPGHVQHIQMPNDDMVLIVPPDMDSLLSGVNIVSDVNGHHHFQKCSGNGTLNNHPHNQHSQHSLQTLNTSQGLVNGTVSNGMMTRTPFCILNQVECAPTGNETNGGEHHVTQSVVGQAAFSTNHIGINTQNLTHHRGTMIDQNQGQQSHHHQLHHHPQQQHQLQQSQHQPQHPSQLANSHNQHHLPQSHLTTTTAVNSNGGASIESQLKNLLFNLLLKDGQQTSTVPLLQSSNQESKHRSDMLAIIASSLTKIEGHLSKISKVASTLMAHNVSLNLGDNNERTTSNQSHNSGASAININNSDGNNNNVDIPVTRSNNRRDDER